MIQLEKKTIFKSPLRIARRKTSNILVWLFVDNLVFLTCTFHKFLYFLYGFEFYTMPHFSNPQGHTDNFVEPINTLTISIK